MKNEHLVPPAVFDIIDKLQQERLGDNERMALLQRLEVIRDYCQRVLDKEQKKKWK